MSLRAIFLLVIGGLTLLAALATGVAAANSWSHYQRAKRLLVEDAFLAAAAADWVRERAALGTALASTRAGHSLVGIATASRHSANENFEAAMASFAAGQPSPFMITLLNQADEARARVSALRGEIRAALRQPADSRPQALGNNWFSAMTNLIERAQLLRLVAGGELRDAAPEIEDLRMLRHFAWTAAERAGRERAIMGRLVSSGMPIDAATAGALARSRGEIELAWEMVRFFAADIEAPGAVRDAIRNAGSAYFGDFRGLRERVIEAGLAGESYPVTAEEWHRSSSQATDTLLAVEAAGGLGAAAAIKDAFGQAICALALQGALFLCGAAIAAGVFLLLSRRIIEPIRRLTAATRKLARGEVEVEIPAIVGDDEIAGMASALNVFRENIAARVRLEAELRDARDQAQAANRIKSEFLANMSHELRTPLNAIIGFSELMRQETFGPIGQQQYRDYVGDVHDSGRHLLSIINDILDMSKIEVGRMTLNEEIAEVEDLIAGCRRMIDERAHNAGLDLVVAVEQDMPSVRVDPLKLRQILLNLLSNAVKFTPAGGRVVCRAYRNDAQEPVFEVADTGIGIDAQEIAVALEPFRQVDSALSRRHEGTGLGLALSRGLAELHGGRLELESRPGEGTTVRLVLPAERLVPAVGALRRAPLQASA